jgi:NMD protein affecting ribosome stability and mRNA decay
MPELWLTCPVCDEEMPMSAAPLSLGSEVRRCMWCQQWRPRHRWQSRERPSVGELLEQARRRAVSA